MVKVKKRIIYVSPHTDEDLGHLSSSLQIQNIMSKSVYGLLEKTDFETLVINSPSKLQDNGVFIRRQQKAGTIRLGYINLFLLREISLSFNLFNCLRKELNKNDIVLGYNFGPTFFLALLFCKKKKVLFGTFFLDPPTIFPGLGLLKDILFKIWNNISKVLSKKINFVISIAPPIIEDFFPSLPSKNKLVFPLCYSHDYLNEINSFRYNETKVNSEDNLSFLFAGNLDYHNDIELLLKVFSKRPNMNLILYGGGRLEQIVLEYSKKYDNIKYNGLADYSTLIKAYQSTDILLAPRSIKNDRDKFLSKYGVSSKLSELLLFGKPVITRNIPAIPENIIDYVFKYDSDDDFIKIIYDMNNYYKCYYDLAQANKEKYVRNFSWDNQVNLLEEFLESLKED